MAFLYHIVHLTGEFTVGKNGYFTTKITGICWQSIIKTYNRKRPHWWSLFLIILFPEEERKIRRLVALLLKTMRGIYIFLLLCKHWHSFRCKVCLKKISSDEYFRICEDCKNHICEDCSSYSKQDDDSHHLSQVYIGGKGRHPQ